MWDETRQQLKTSKYHIKINKNYTQISEFWSVRFSCYARHFNETFVGRKIFRKLLMQKFVQCDATKLNWTENNQWVRELAGIQFLDRVYIKTNALYRWWRRQIVLQTSGWSKTFRGYWHWLSLVTCLAVLYSWWTNCTHLPRHISSSIGCNKNNHLPKII